MRKTYARNIPHDDRIPTSVHWHGIYKVSVFDEGLYAQNVREYYGDDPPTLAPNRTRRSYNPFRRKRKGNRSYGWADGIDMREYRKVG